MVCLLPWPAIIVGELGAHGATFGEFLMGHMFQCCRKEMCLCLVYRHQERHMSIASDGQAGWADKGSDVFKLSDILMFK